MDDRFEAGPVLLVEARDDVIEVLMPVGTEGMAEKVRRFLKRFRGLASSHGRPREGLRIGDDLLVRASRRSLAQHVRRVVVTTVGVGLLLLGIILLAAPGPGLLMITLGLAVLATQYDLAKDALLWVKERYRDATDRLRSRRPRS